MGEPTRLYKAGDVLTVFGPAQLAAALAEGWQTQPAPAEPQPVLVPMSKRVRIKSAAIVEPPDDGIVAYATEHIGKGQAAAIDLGARTARRAKADK